MRFFILLAPFFLGASVPYYLLTKLEPPLEFLDYDAYAHQIAAAMLVLNKAKADELKKMYEEYSKSGSESPTQWCERLRILYLRLFLLSKKQIPNDVKVQLYKIIRIHNPSKRQLTELQKLDSGIRIVSFCRQYRLKYDITTCNDSYKNYRFGKSQWSHTKDGVLYFLVGPESDTLDEGAFKSFQNYIASVVTEARKAPYTQYIPS